MHAGDAYRQNQDGGRQDASLAECRGAAHPPKALITSKVRTDNAYTLNLVSFSHPLGSECIVMGVTVAPPISMVFFLASSKY